MKRATLLIVDDNYMNLRMAQKIFEYYYDVETVSSGEEALRVARERKPDLILLDVHMPGMDGHLVIQQLKANVDTRDIPVIFLTADDDAETEVQGLREGALDFITKPIRKDIALQRIGKVLELDYLHKRLQAEVDTLNLQKQEEAIDEISGLPTRRIGQQSISEAMETHGGCFAFLDVDNLKKVNDTMGHECGDRLLRLMGNVLLENREQSVVCRLGGDEFLCYMMDVNEEQASEKIEHIMSSFLSRKDADTALRQASLSVGLCMCEPGEDYGEIYSCADKALYHVKQNGKAGYYFYRQQENTRKHRSEVDLEQLMRTLSNSGSYSGAMDVEFREFAKLFEYVGNLRRRYHHGFHLVMVTLDEHGGDNATLDELENGMILMENAIQQTIRNVDIYTRYSSSQYLVILFEAGDENVELVMDRIFAAYRREAGEGCFEPTYSVRKLELGDDI